MNLITRTIPALLLGLSGLTLNTASQADSSFSVTISSGYPVSSATYAYHDSYRPYTRTHHRHHRPPAHVVYKDYGHRRHHGHYRKNNDRHGHYGHHNAHQSNEHYGRYGHHNTQKKYRDRGRDDHRAREYGDRRERRHHTSYARAGHY